MLDCNEQKNGRGERGGEEDTSTKNALMIATVNVEIKKFLKGKSNDCPKTKKAQTVRWRVSTFEGNTKTNWKFYLNRKTRREM